MLRRPDPSARAPLASARWAVMAQFVLFGLIMASWTSRMPSVRDALGVTALQLGSLLIVGGIGSLIGALTVGALIGRFGTRRVLAAGTAGNVVGFAVLAFALAEGSFPLFVVGSLVNGWCGALVNVPINVNGAAVERGLGRTVLPQFHAGFSIGAGLGALTGAGFAWAGVDIAWQIVVITIVVTVLRALTLVAATSPSHDADASARPARGRAGAGSGAGGAGAAHGRGRAPGAMRTALSAWLEPHTLLLGLVLLSASIAEGSANSWLAIAVVDGFDTSEATGAVAFGTFDLAMTAFRFIGSRLVDRFGRVAVLRGSGAAALVGVAAFVFAPTLWLAWVGIVLWGCGAALSNPIAIAAASDDPARAAQRVPVVTSFSTITMLTAPPLLGMLADEVGARLALSVVGIAAIVSLSVAGAVRPRRADDAPAAKPVDAEAGAYEAAPDEPASGEFASCAATPASRSASPTTPASRD
ncbi:MFS transporter [Agromyces soli]